MYSIKEEVCPHDIDTIYKKTLEDQLTENVIAKKQWVCRWKPTIESSINRAKRNDTTRNKLIWDCFNHGKRPFHRVDRSRLIQLKKQKIEEAKTAPRQRPIHKVDGYKPVAKKRSTSRHVKSTWKKKIILNEYRSVKEFFTTKQKCENQQQHFDLQIDDRYDDAPT